MARRHMPPTRVTQTFYVVRTFETITYFQVEAYSEEEAKAIAEKNDPLISYLATHDCELACIISQEKFKFEWEMREANIISEDDIEAI